MADYYPLPAPVAADCRAQLTLMQRYADCIGTLADLAASGAVDPGTPEHAALRTAAEVAYAEVEECRAWVHDALAEATTGSAGVTYELPGLALGTLAPHATEPQCPEAAGLWRAAHATDQQALGLLGSLR